MTLGIGMMRCPCALHRKMPMQAYEDGETDFRICPECGIAFREKFPSPNELEEIYRQAYTEEKIGSGNTNQESGGYAARSYAEFIRRSLWKSGARVLDYGAGSGELVEQLHSSGVDAEGLEFSDKARCYCREKRGFALLSNLADIPDGYYHVVSMVEVIEHLTDIPGALADVHRILAPGGYFLVTTPNRRGLKATMQGGYWREAQKKFHLFLFDSTSLAFHLGEAGFVDVRRVAFSPLQRSGISFFLRSRLIQLFRVHGTLCVVAKRP